MRTICSVGAECTCNTGSDIDTTLSLAPLEAVEAFLRLGGWLPSTLDGSDCASLRGDAENSTLDDVLRSLSAGTGIGRGLRGMTVFFERPVGLSSLGGDERGVAGAVRLS